MLRQHQPTPIREPNYQGPFGNTLLHGAVVSGDAREVRRLLAAGADPKIRNRDGRTPLQAARMLRQTKIYALLSAAAARVRRIRRSPRGSRQSSSAP